MDSGVIEIVGWGLAFAVTAIIGGWIARSYERNNWLFQRRIEGAKERYERNSSLVSRFFEIASGRISASESYIRVLRTLDLEAISEERERYRASADRWSSESAPIAHHLSDLIGQEKVSSISKYLSEEFSSLDRTMRQVRVAIEGRKAVQGNLLRKSDGIVYLMRFRLEDIQAEMEYLLSEEKALIDQRPKIEFKNREFLSHSYLVKSLFELRSNS